MLKILKYTLKNILFLYKNFFHWNISKVLIIFPLFLWVTLSSFLGLGIVGTIISILILSFIQLLLSNLNLSYKKNKKLDFTKNNYFNIKLFLKTSNIILIIFSLLLINFLIFYLISYLIFLAFGGNNFSMDIFIQSGNFNLFSIVLLVFFIIYIFSSIYLMYKSFFSYYILSENKEFSALKSIKKSFKITKSKKSFFKFIIINLFLIILFIPILFIKGNLDLESKKISYYTYLNNKKALAKSFIKNKNRDEFYDYKRLELKYKKLSTQELVGKTRFIYIMQLLYFLFSFLFIYGILDFIYASFYRKELNK